LELLREQAPQSGASQSLCHLHRQLSSLIGQQCVQLCSAGSWCREIHRGRIV
jgi:hypothetical protein